MLSRNEICAHSHDDDENDDGEEKKRGKFTVVVDGDHFFFLNSKCRRLSLDICFSDLLFVFKLKAEALDLIPERIEELKRIIT